MHFYYYFGLDGNVRNRNVPPQYPQSTVNKTELMRMKENNFMEAKSVMLVFDEILRNATEISDLKGSCY
jgi:hypothetical protein